MVIAIEGLDGSGKTTLINRLRERLEHIDVIEFGKTISLEAKERLEDVAEGDHLSQFEIGIEDCERYSKNKEKLFILDRYYLSTVFFSLGTLLKREGVINSNNPIINTYLRLLFFNAKHLEVPVATFVLNPTRFNRFQKINDREELKGFDRLSFDIEYETAFKRTVEYFEDNNIGSVYRINNPYSISEKQLSDIEDIVLYHQVKV